MLIYTHRYSMQNVSQTLVLQLMLPNFNPTIHPSLCPTSLYKVFPKAAVAFRIAQPRENSTLRIRRYRRTRR